jgi:hypothetical protein
MREINRKKTEKDILREEKIKKNSEEKFEESERRNREREEKKEAKVELDSENGKYILTLEQEKEALDLWRENKDNIDLRAICEKMFGFSDLRMAQGKALKDFFYNKTIRIKKGSTVPEKKEYELTEDQKKFLTNNRDIYESRIELCRSCFDDPILNPLSKEARAAFRFLEEIGAFGLNPNMPDFLTDRRHTGSKEYKAPATPLQAIKLVNSCLRDVIDSSNISIREKRNMESLISYMNKNRFLRQITSYTEPEDRTTFENSFISYVYDKGDLTQEELDQYIILSTSVVEGFQIQKMRSKTLKTAEDLLDREDNESKVLGKGLVDHAAQLNTEYNQCVKRQESLFKNLTEKRSERLQQLKGRDYNFFNLVEAWREQENRDKLIKRAERLKDESKERIEELDDMSEIDAMILGMSKEEFLYG